MTNHPSSSNLHETDRDARSDDDLRDAIRLHVEQRAAFRVHLAFFVVGMLTIVGVNLMTNLSAGIAGDRSAWWSAWALIGWGIGISIHGLVVWFARPEALRNARTEREVDDLLARTA